LQRWQLLFNKYDADGDGRISLAELKRLIRSESYTRDIPGHTVKQILKLADEDGDGYLDYQEFLKMVCNDFVECFTL
jgi:Ca2+-binding EF-hand superfamily protein